MATMKRVLTRKSQRHPESRQLAMLQEAGVKSIYSYEVDGIDAFIGSLRSGDEACMTTLGRLGPTREKLRVAVAAIRKIGAVIIELKTGRRSDKPGHLDEMIFDAADELAGDKKVHKPGDAKRYGSLGGKPKKEPVLSDADAKALWTNPEGNPDEVLKILGISASAAYRRYGKSGRSPGRPLGDRAATYVPPELYIYFIQGKPGTPVKIGLTAKIKGRLSALSTGHYENLNVLALISGGYSDEKKLHNRFTEYRLRGEWFKYEGRLKAFIEKLPKYKAKN